MTVKKDPKGGSPYADSKQAILDEYDIKGVSPAAVYIIDRNLYANVNGTETITEKNTPIVLKKPIGKELGTAHLELLLEMQADEPLREFDPSTGTERTLPSPSSGPKRNAAMKSWFEKTLPRMLILPESPDELNYAEQFMLFTTVFSELENANRTFRLLR